MRIKNLLLCVIFISATFALTAQINPGKYLLGGSFNFYTAKTNQTSPDTKNESLYLNIQLGKVIKENTVVGVSASYGHINTYANTDYEAKNDYYSAGVFYRKYKPLIKNLYFIAEGNASYVHGVSKQSLNQPGNNGTKTVSNGASAYFVPGVSYGISKRIQIELVMPNLAGITYSHSKITYPTLPSTNLNHEENSFSFNGNLNANLLSNFGIGFKLLLGK